MGGLREKIFHHTINTSLANLRSEMCKKYKPKKEGRFFLDGITYEVSEGKLTVDGIQIEISSKIPNEIFDKKGLSEKYFKEIKRIMSSKDKKPLDVKMENIIHSTTINEIKERDYVKCTYVYKEDELFTDSEVMKVVKEAESGKVDLSGITGVNTAAGRAVIYIIGENIFKTAKKNLEDLVDANSEAAKKF
ncbi:MAG: hypothetical protein OEY64_08490 [Nitrospinota bacterium]|nr:hypothetical protein [Nitrospinota bacterium]